MKRNCVIVIVLNENDKLKNDTVTWSLPKKN